MEQVQTQPTQGLTNKGAALWNKQQWHEFMEHAKAVAPQLTGKVDDKNPMSPLGDIGFLTTSTIYCYNL